MVTCPSKFAAGAFGTGAGAKAGAGAGTGAGDLGAALGIKADGAAGVGFKADAPAGGRIADNRGVAETFRPGLFTAACFNKADSLPIAGNVLLPGGGALGAAGIDATDCPLTIGATGAGGPPSGTGAAAPAPEFSGGVG
jgi:hypothetical protein